MLKIMTAILSLMFIVSSVWSACDSCGSECARACGTRRFRACCFNYLRRKRDQNVFKTLSLAQDVKESQPKSEVPVNNHEVEDIAMPEQWTVNVFSNENHPNSVESILENRLD